MVVTNLDGNTQGIDWLGMFGNWWERASEDGVNILPLRLLGVVQFVSLETPLYVLPGCSGYIHQSS